MNRARFEALVEEVLEGLPDWVREGIENLSVVVEDEPSPEQDPDGEGLLGLYEGISLPERDSDYVDVMPDVVYVYRLPHLETGLRGSALKDEIRRTVLHELAHYFGFDDDHLDEIGMG